MKFRLAFASQDADLETAKGMLKGNYELSEKGSELAIEFRTLEEVLDFVKANYSVVLTEEPAIIVYDAWLEVH